MSDTKIQWHPGFVAAMNLELEQNRDDLIYEREYNLNTKPLEIDLLVIKKEPGVQIVNEIGKLFRGHNIIEYKSPMDHCNVDALYKATAYGCLYKASGRYVDERKADDITVTILRDVKPEGLFQYFEKHHIQISNPYAGVYYILDTVFFPTQILVGRELDQKNHIWLKALSDRIRKQEMRELMERVYSLTDKYERELADSVLEVSVRANKHIAGELRGEGKMCQALLELMEPEIDKIVGKERERVTREVTQVVTREVTREVTEEVTEKVTKKVTKNVAEGMAKKMLNSGKFTVEELQEYVPWLTVEEIEKLSEKKRTE